MDKFLKDLKEAQNIIQTVDYFLYMVFPLVKDKKLLIKIFVELKKAISKIINVILQYEYVFKRISLYKNSETNFKTFEKKCAKRYGISFDEIKLIKELFLIIKKHENSSMEFIKENKVVILGTNMEKEILTEERAKKFLLLAKDVFKKTSNCVLKR